MHLSITLSYEELGKRKLLSESDQHHSYYSKSCVQTCVQQNANTSMMAISITEYTFQSEAVHLDYHYRRKYVSVKCHHPEANVHMETLPNFPRPVGI